MDLSQWLISAPGDFPTDSLGCLQAVTVCFGTKQIALMC